MTRDELFSTLVPGSVIISGKDISFYTLPVYNVVSTREFDRDACHVLKLRFPIVVIAAFVNERKRFLVFLGAEGFIGWDSAFT